MIDTARLSFVRVALRSVSLFTILLLAAAVLLGPGQASAQEFRGTISGKVTDSTGAVVRDVEVTITEMSTGTINRTKTDSAGQYVVHLPFPAAGHLPGRRRVDRLQEGSARRHHSAGQ